MIIYDFACGLSKYALKRDPAWALQHVCVIAVPLLTHTRPGQTNMVSPCFLPSGLAHLSPFAVLFLTVFTHATTRTAHPATACEIIVMWRLLASTRQPRSNGIT